MTEYQCTLCNSIYESDSLNYCISCRSAVCEKCSRVCYPNRARVCSCIRCPPLNYVFSCGRCNCGIPYADLEFFCDMCALPICFDCIRSDSFEGGLLKCAKCCSEPMTQAPLLRMVGSLVTEDLLRRLPVPLVSSAAPTAGPSVKSEAPSSSSSLRMMTTTEAPPHCSKYRKLLGKEKLGEGAQGVVYKCRTETGEIVVSKEMMFMSTDMASFEAQVRQVARMQKLNHPHLIRYLDVVVQKEPLRICVIMPYYNEGDLKKFIERQRKPVTEVKLCSIVLQIAGAMHYLHTQNPPLVHRDIKPENILLLNNEEQVLLMDLDLCRAVDITASVFKRREQSPTFEYRAPELECSMGDTKADVFSLGVVMFVLATLPDFPCVANDKNEMVVLSAPQWTDESLRRSIYREVKKVRRYSYSEEFIQLVISMLIHEPAKRPTAGEVMNRLQHIMECRLMEGKE